MNDHPVGFDSATEGHTDALVLAAVTALLDLVDRSLEGGVGDLAERHPFVDAYVEDLARRLPRGVSWEESIRWWEQRIAAIERVEGVDLPLTRVPNLASVRDRLVLAVFALPSEDERFVRVTQELQGTAVGDGFSVATVVAALERPGERTVLRLVERLTEQHVLVAAVGAPQVRHVATPVWSAVRDGEMWSALVEQARPPDDTAVLGHWHADRRSALQRPLDLLVAGRIDTVVVRQVPGADGERVVAAALGATGRRTSWCTRHELVDGPGLALAAMVDAVPGAAVEAEPGEQVDGPRPPWYTGPLVVLTGTTGAVRTAAEERRATVTLRRGDLEGRRRLWGALIPRLSHTKKDVLARSFVVPDGYVRRLTSDARVIAQVDGRRVPDVADVRIASRRLCDHVLETKATRVENRDLTWDDVVTGEAVRADLEMLEQRCRLREELAAGDRAVGSSGVRALLTGPSGCGKTLAARALASVLERNLYRVDLAAVFDKYVGVTEKILDRLLTDAEQLDGVLLMDEGDSFLGSRTDVRSANDRYANLETNFLLQRLEEYSGIVVITTNAPDRIDGAFSRRMDTTISFGKPRAVARRSIWSLHLPPDHRLAPEEVAAIGDGHRLTGGQIRNAAQHARLLSMRSGRPVDLALARDAVAAEYRKAGAMPAGRTPEEPPIVEGLDRYIRSMAASRGRRPPRTGKDRGRS